jgi:hypothetical protein
MMEVLGGLPLPALVSIVTVLGPMGLVLILWHADHRRFERESQARRDEVAAVMIRYEKDMAAVVRMYEDNVILVRGYERLSGDLANIIHLNTQVQTRLVEKISNNMYCPVNRKESH